MANKIPTEPPTFREYTIGGLVAKLEGKEQRKPQVCYEFSGGAKKYDTDQTSSGIYEK